MSRSFRSAPFALAFVLLASSAHAHTGVGGVDGFAAGLMHPVLGPDHVLAMVAVGLFAALLGGRALWAVPAAFVCMMLTGGALGLSGFAVPAVETGIAVSVIAIGAAVAFGRRWPVLAAMALVGAFAIFHGHAHGAEMDAAHGAVLYSLGFALATATLHGAGIGLGLAASRPGLVRAGGAVIALAGLVLAAA